MAEAINNLTPPAPTVQPLSDDWMLLPKAFAWVTDILGDPVKALREIHRHLLRSELRSLRRRRLNDSPEDIELAPTFWQGVKLSVGMDRQGRDVVAIERTTTTGVQHAVFYLYRPDVYRIWPAECASVQPGTPVSDEPLQIVSPKSLSARRLRSPFVRSRSAHPDQAVRFPEQAVARDRAGL